MVDISKASAGNTIISEACVCPGFIKEVNL